MLPRRSILSYLHTSNQGFFSIAALLILLTLVVAIYVLSSQLKSPTNWLSRAAEVPDACTGTLDIPSCYEDGTPTALKVEWSAAKNPDRDCNVYLNGADPATQEVVSTECKGSKTYSYATSRLLGNPLGNQDIYQLGLDNSLPGCTVKQLAEIRAEDVCRDKKTAGPKPTAPSPTIAASDCKKIIADFGLTYVGFSDSEVCVISDQLTQLNANFSLVTKIQAITKESRTQFKKVDTSTAGESVCSVTEIIIPSNATSQALKAKLLSAYMNLLLQCGAEQSNLWRQANNIWSEEGGITPATYNPSPLKSSPQSSSGCKSAIGQIDRKDIGDIVRYDYIAVLASRIDPNYLKTYKQSLSDPYCTDQYPFANKANPRQCQLAETILNPKSASVCGQIQTSTTKGNTEFGIQVDFQNNKIPSTEQYNALSPQWSRFVYKRDVAMDLNRIKNSKLIIFNQQSFFPDTDPIGKTDQTTWNKYIELDKKSYLSSLKKFVTDNRSNIEAIEVWNEPDLAPTGNEKTSYIPPAIYAKMLKLSAKTIKDINPNIKVISAGMAGQDVPKYLRDMQAADKDVFTQVDGIGLHPYVQSPRGWGKNFGLISDVDWILGAVSDAAKGKPIWVTEIGQSVRPGFSPQDQAEYLDRMYTIFKEKNLPMAGWYGWIDSMLGGPADLPGFGLYDSNGKIKPSGQMFAKFAKGLK